MLLQQDGVVIHPTIGETASRAVDEGVDGLRKALETLRGALPWLADLPEADAEEFLHEFVDVARGTAALGGPEPLTTLLTQWRHAAEVHADPALRALIEREPGGDYGAAAPPEEPPAKSGT